MNSKPEADRGGRLGRAISGRDLEARRDDRWRDGAGILDGSPDTVWCEDLIAKIEGKLTQHS